MIKLIDLPKDIVSYIYSYDPTYRNKYNDVIQEILSTEIKIMHEYFDYDYLILQRHNNHYFTVYNNNDNKTYKIKVLEYSKLYDLIMEDINPLFKKLSTLCNKIEKIKNDINNSNLIKENLLIEINNINNDLKTFPLSAFVIINCVYSFTFKYADVKEVKYDNKEYFLLFEEYKN